MTGLIDEILEENLFQNNKMADKESRNLQINIIEGILKRVSDLKQTAKELEDFARQLKKKMNTTMEMDELKNHVEKDKNVKSSSKQNLLKCNLCDKRFQINSDLEKHIKTRHENYQSYNCRQCKKNFVTKWRLQKHERIHSNIKTRQCKYFKTQTKCPFDELGCKFRHETKIEDTNPTQKGSTELSEYSINMETTIDKVSGSVTSDDSMSFYTSTPRKCEECLDKSKCVDCIVKHMLGRHGVARAMFS